MATLATVTLAAQGRTAMAAAGVTSGVVVGYQAAQIGGDFVPYGGQYTLIRFKTTGTACTWTLDSTTTPSFGVDQDPTVVLAATDEQEILIKNDGRFDAGGGNAGYIKCTPSTVTGAPQIACKVIP